MFLASTGSTDTCIGVSNTTFKIIVEFPIRHHPFTAFERYEKKQIYMFSLVTCQKNAVSRQRKKKIQTIKWKVVLLRNRRQTINKK